MAAGKSTIGRELARELGVAFVDTDDLIVARNGPVAELFARAGEARFRDAELEAVREALASAPGVIALGGGAVTHAPTQALLAERALRVYLDISVEALLARLRRSRTVRPLLGPNPSLERIRELLDAREPFYREAEIIVSGPRRSKRAFAREIAERLAAHSVL
jgi:shikimate kinase